MCNTCVHCGQCGLQPRVELEDREHCSGYAGVVSRRADEAKPRIVRLLLVDLRKGQPVVIAASE
jgi:hypothetical protein